MTAVAYDQIEEKAEEILNRFEMNELPVDPLLIAQLEGISVINADFTNDNFSGLIQKLDHGQNTMYVKNTDTPQRKRFTIAHELGHYYLHFQDSNEQYIDSVLNFYRDTEPNQSDNDIEVEANRFAASLLMPKPMVEIEWDKDLSVEQMANKFGVSLAAMGYRLNYLGLQI